MIREKPIGVFDSGIGGLTVLKALKELMPNENFIYFGDTARVPYGNKSPKTIINYSIENASFLVSKGIKALVVACNTSSCYSIDILKKNFNIPVIGVVKPASLKAVLVSKRKQIGVIGTASTINSGKYKEEIFKFYKKYYPHLNGKLKIYQKACPLFVPLVEEGLHNSKIAYQTASLYLNELKGKVDTLVLGCTHYPLLKKVIQGILPNVKIIDSAHQTALALKNFLRRFKLLNKKNNNPYLEIYVSDKNDNFVKLAKEILKKDYLIIERPWDR